MSETVNGVTFVELILSGDDGLRLEKLADASKCSPEELLLRLIRRCDPAIASNGHQGYAVACGGCGLTFFSARRPDPKRKHWCDDCRANGAAARARQQDFRDRHRRES